MTVFDKNKNLKDFLIYENSTLSLALKLLNISANKCLCVIDNKKKFVGTISDGDIRKGLIKNNNLNQKIKYLYNKKPYWIYENFIDKKKINYLFFKKKIDILPVLNKSGTIKKILTKEDFINSSYIDYKKCTVLIMAGGKGKRLLPHTIKIPKPLLSINGQVMILRIIEKFSKQNFNHFFLTINYKKKLIKKVINSQKIYNKDDLIIDFVEEKKPLGTIGSLSLVDKDKLSDPFIVTNCDTLINHDFEEFLEHHKKNKSDFTIITAEKKIVMPFGNITTIKNKVVNIQEKPEFLFNLNVGFYIINKKCLSILRKNSKCDATTFISKLLNSKYRIGTFNINFDNWTEIGRTKEFNEYNQLSSL